MVFYCWKRQVCISKVEWSCCSGFENIALIKLGQILLNCLQIKSTQCGPTCAPLSKVLSKFIEQKSKLKVISSWSRDLCCSLSQWNLVPIMWSAILFTSSTIWKITWLPLPLIILGPHALANFFIKLKRY